MLVDVHLDELDLALGGAHRLFQDRRELLAGAAPRRPEIDQHRLALEFLDHVLHEGLCRGVLDEPSAARGCLRSAATWSLMRLPLSLANRPPAVISPDRLIKWEEMRPNAIAPASAQFAPDTGLDPRLMAGGLQESHSPSRAIVVVLVLTSG